MNSYWIQFDLDKTQSHILDKNLVCDVCIVGAGMFGLTTAYYLSKKGFNVVVLDKSNIGEKVSGHTTAKITSQHGLIYSYLVKSFGHEIAKKYLYANEEAITNIKEIITSETIDCNYINQNNYVYASSEKDVDYIKEELSIIKKLDFNPQYVSNVPLPFDTFGAIMFPNQAMFHPLKYMFGLYNAIIKNFGQVFTNTLVTDIKKEAKYYKTFTGNYSIKSKYVVIASHYPFITFPGFYSSKMYQDTSYIIGIDTKTPIFDGMFITSSSPTLSLRFIRDEYKDILLIGGANHKTGANNVTEASTYKILEQKAKEYFPNCEILYKWNTKDCMTLDKIPYIGEFSNLTPNMYVGTGFNKWGMTSSNIAANIVTDKILGIKNKYEDVFTSTRLKPLKNKEELKNIVKQTSKSLIIEKIEISNDTIKEIKKDTAKIIKINGNNVGIYRSNNDKIYAVKPVCTHLGCSLVWNNVDKTWDCPCHGSRFNYLGKNLYDPAFKDLKTYNL